MLQKICSLQRMTPPITLDRGLLSASGATVPEDGTDGYQPACYFQDTTNGKIYINEGSVTSCEFNTSTTGGASDTITIGAFASLLKGSGIPLSSTQTSSIVAYGDDNGLAIASSVYNIRSRLLLTVDQDGASIRALMGQLKLATGVDVSTGIYTAVQGYVELAGDTSVETTATFSCIDASLEIASGKTLTVDSGGEACGIHVETTGAGTISATGTCAGILIDKASGAPDWTNGVIVKNSTRGVVLTGITAQAIDIQTSGVFRMGVEGTGVPMSNTYPYGLEIHTKTTTDFAQPGTGVSAGIYSRYEHSYDQTTATGHAAVFAKLRVKQDLGDGVHAASYNYVEISGTTIVGGTSTTQTCAGMFAVEAPDTLNLTTGYLCGIVVSSTIGSSATTTGSVLGVRITRSGTSHPWDTGIAIDDSSSAIGISVGTCTTAAISISGDQVLGVLFHATAAATAAYAVTVPTGITLDKGLDINCTSTGIVTSGLTMQGTGTVTTGITLSMAASTTGILISATACATGISITAGSLTDGIKISGATPVDGVEVSSVCSGAALHVSGASATGLSISAACTTEAITIATQAVSIMTAGLTATGSSKLDGLDFNWSTATTYGSAGDRWGGNGNMEAFLTIGDTGAASVVSGSGSHLGAYINLSYTATAADANDLCGGLYTAVSYGATETIGKVCGITSHIRNPDQDISGASQECNAIRALMYTGTGGETQHYCGILLGVLDMTTTKSNGQDIVGMRVQLNVADNSAGGNLSGIVFDNPGTVEPDTGLWYLANNWQYAMVTADGGAAPKPGTDSGTCSTAAGAIKVKIGGSVRYIPLYTTYSS